MFNPGGCKHVRGGINAGYPSSGAGDGRRQISGSAAPVKNKLSLLWLEQLQKGFPETGHKGHIGIIHTGVPLLTHLYHPLSHGSCVMH
ncbi:hypothetical protein D3C75_922140 [compost metagenome]